MPSLTQEEKNNIKKSIETSIHTLQVQIASLE